MLNHIKYRIRTALRVFVWRARARQVAALCYRTTDSGKKVLLITSRDTGRWIVPKGWPMDGLDDAQAAMREAWEEAGVKTAAVQPDPIGNYRYDKRLACGDVTPVQTQVYVAKVETLAHRYPERKQRKRAWFSPGDAAERVHEPELKAILRAF